jgi:hypothetical protein
MTEPFIEHRICYPHSSELCDFFFTVSKHGSGITRERSKAIELHFVFALPFPSFAMLTLH